MRLLLALLSSALTAAVLQMIDGIAENFPQSLGRSLDNQFGTFMLFYVLAGVFATVLGLPAFLIAKRFNAANIWTSALAGLAIGCLFSHLFLNRPVMAFEGPLTSHAESLPLTLWIYVVFGGTGLASGLVFWWVRGFKRQSKALAPPRS